MSLNIFSMETAEIKNLTAEDLSNIDTEDLLEVLTEWAETFDIIAAVKKANHRRRLANTAHKDTYENEYLTQVSRVLTRCNEPNTLDAVPVVHLNNKYVVKIRDDISTVYLSEYVTESSAYSIQDILSFYGWKAETAQPNVYSNHGFYGVLRCNRDFDGWTFHHDAPHFDF